MKKILLLIATVWLPFSGNAQPDFEALQNQWVQALQTTEPTADFYWEGKNFTFAKIDSTHARNVIQRIKSEQLTGLKNYEHGQIFRHDDQRYLSTGMLMTEGKNLLLLTGWRNVDGFWKKEIDVILSLKANSTAPFNQY